MKSPFEKIFRTNFSSKLEGRVGVRAYFLFGVSLAIQYMSLALWYQSSTVVTGLFKFMMLKGFLTGTETVTATIIVTFGLAVLIFGTLFREKNGKAIILIIACLLEKFIIDQLFNQKLFFTSFSFISYKNESYPFQNYIPLLPYIPPRAPRLI
ncbi:MAG: hypothetical protein M0Z83_07220 [Betaproteobacteria bacterium]|nr:hypothetical protein [Betaproteobacteria bacterium]